MGQLLFTTKSSLLGCHTKEKPWWSSLIPFRWHGWQLIKPVPYVKQYLTPGFKRGVYLIWYVNELPKLSQIFVSPNFVKSLWRTTSIWRFEDLRILMIDEWLLIIDDGKPHKHRTSSHSTHQQSSFINHHSSIINASLRGWGLSAVSTQSATKIHSAFPPVETLR